MLAAFGRMVKTGMTSVFQVASEVSRLRILSGLFFSKATQGGCQHDGQVADDAQMYGGLATEGSGCRDHPAASGRSGECGGCRAQQCESGEHQCAHPAAQAACGYRRVGRLRNAILFHLGGVDLYPESVPSW